LLIIGVILLVWLTLVIIELIIIFEKEDEENKNSISEINCIYTISDIGNNYILGKDFIINSISKIIIDDNKEVSSSAKEYNFLKSGNHTVKFFINGDLSLDNMFKDINNIISIKMSSDKKTKITSMIGTFENCNMLNEFNIIGFDTSEIKSMSRLFYNCNLNIDSNIFKNISTDNIEDFSYIFYNKRFSELNLEIKSKNARNMSHMFDNCISLKILKLEIDTSNVLDMSFMFKSCTSLKSLDISKFNTKKVRDMSFMFYRCFVLEKLDVSHFDTREVENMSNMLNAASTLTSLDISKFNTEKVTNMSEIFRYMENIDSLDLSKLDTSLVSDMSSRDSKKLAQNGPAQKGPEFLQSTYLG
jgi:surface protein